MDEIKLAVIPVTRKYQYCLLNNNTFRIVKMMRKLIIKYRFTLLMPVLFLFSLYSSDLAGQAEESAEEICNDENIKTILLYRAGWDLSMPVLIMDEDESLELHFDYLGEPQEDYSYSVINCTYDWKINPIPEHYYLDGFNDIPVYDYHPSRNTTRYFTHYTARIPGDDLQITGTGNYLLKVYKNNDPDSIAFTRRFAVARKTTDIIARVNRPDNENQELMLQIDLGKLRLTNPLEEVKIVILKNYDWNNLVNINSGPLLQDNWLHLDMPYQILSPGGNEFRYADTKSTKFISERVDRIEYDVSEFNFYLKPDELKQYEPYFYSADLNGRSFYEIPDAHDRHLESDYVKVHFILESPQSLGTDLYIYGALTDWRTGENNYMTYNPDRQAYEKTLLLKQGLLNYWYVTRDYNTNVLMSDITEGNHAETENDYLIFIYLRKTMSDRDQLVGFTIVNSAENHP